MSGNQRRPPKDMQGLLKFCLEATRAEDAPDLGDPEAVLSSMGEERRTWLQEALETMSVDVIEQLGNGIKVLTSNTADLETKEEVLDCLEDWLGNIDTAVNFHKIGGFASLTSCLSSPHPSLRSGALHLAAELSQNNPYCQEKFLSEEFLVQFLAILDTDSDPHCQVKALYAVSCLVRDHPPALSVLAQLDGWSVVIRAIMRKEPRLRTKGCFLISSVAEQEETVVQEMVSRGMVSQLVVLLTSQQPDLSQEHLLRALRVLLASSAQAREEADQLGLLQALGDRLGSVRGREEFQESLEHCEHLLRLLAGGGLETVSVKSGEAWGGGEEIFNPSADWKDIKAGQAVPPGCLVQLDLHTGARRAKKDPDYELPSCLR